MNGPDPRRGPGEGGRFVFLALTGMALLGCDLVSGDEPLPRLGKAPTVRLLDQNGAPFVPQEAMAGEVWVANFVFTSCRTVCPMLSSRMRTLQGALGDRGLRSVSFSVDPTIDTPARLRRYAERFDADLDRWTFVTGSPEAMRSAVVDGFKVYYGNPGPLADPPPDAPEDAYDIPHATHFVLVDRTGTIRGYYRDDPDAQRQLEEDARRLLQAD
ncbi:MAG TPA: SCO family protein [Polyangiaceae bacterium LLY-WYZ-14_1]|nr:SCO family protein [Polyangiaceae bacterium LLY-WYZ-14_1]